MWCARWAKVTFQPTFSDVRFQPADKLHANCASSADVLVASQWQKISELTLILYYNPETIEILRVLPTTKNSTATAKIEYDKIILTIKNPSFASSTEATSLFQLNFKSNVVGQETFVLGTWSEMVVGNKTTPLDATFALNFAKVPECEPDIIPPSINLIFPKDTQKKIALDQYFVFDIKDIGKGIDPNSVVINFDGQQYTNGSDNLKWKGNFLTFYPGTWIPINKTLDLTILATDKQAYWWANTTESTYTFKSATGMFLYENIGPMMFRILAKQWEKISASLDECALLKNIYTSNSSNQQAIKNIIQKVWCDITTLDTIDESWTQLAPITNKNLQQYKNISVFAGIGRILFFLTFALKIHYILAYKKHKKMNK